MNGGENYIKIVYDVINQVRVNIILLSYRGFGLSNGVPSEEGFKLDAEAALNYIKNRKDLKNSPIILYGLSIGGAVAIDLAANNNDQISALMIENSFFMHR